MTYELPLFPLNTVLFPGMPLPLHVFEERYKEMVQVCLDEQRPFGVVLIRSGVAEGGPLADPYDVGCVAEIIEVQKLEDNIKLNIRKQLRDMLESRERFMVQARAMQVAEKRVKSVTMFLEAGRAQIRDLTDAQEDLLEAQNGLTEAATDYRLAELEFQRDTGLLKIDEKRLWQEFTQKGINHGKH